MKQERIEIKPFTMRFCFFLNNKGLHNSTIRFFSGNLGILEKKYDLYNLIFHFTDLHIGSNLGFEEYNINYYHFQEYTSNEEPMYFKNPNSLMNTLIKKLYLFTSPIELMSYWQIFRHKLRESDLLISFPKVINFDGVQELCDSYPGAKITTCFSNTIEGTINDIKISLYKVKKSYAIKLTASGINFNNNEKSFELPFRKLSLYQFSLKSKLKNYKIKTHKPPHSFLTFNSVLHG